MLALALLVLIAMSDESAPQRLPPDAQVLAFALTVSELESKHSEVPQRLRMSIKDGSPVADAALEAMRYRYPNRDVSLGYCNPSEFDDCASLRVEVVSGSDRGFVVRAWAVCHRKSTWSEYCLHFDGRKWLAEKGRLIGGVIG